MKSLFGQKRVKLHYPLTVIVPWADEKSWYELTQQGVFVFFNFFIIPFLKLYALFILFFFFSNFCFFFAKLGHSGKYPGTPLRNVGNTTYLLIFLTYWILNIYQFHDLNHIKKRKKNTKLPHKSNHILKISIERVYSP